jgi:hypothetical protein
MEMEESIGCERFSGFYDWFRFLTNSEEEYKYIDDSYV